MFGIRIYRDHVICRNEDLRHPENRLPLYSISGLKDALEPPLITSQQAAIDYIKLKEPWDIGERVDAFGHKRKNFRKSSSHRRRTTSYMEDRYGSYET